jgi:hypothetical protein
MFFVDAFIITGWTDPRQVVNIWWADHCRKNVENELARVAKDDEEVNKAL